jgi:hypothetical protein
MNRYECPGFAAFQQLFRAFQSFPGGVAGKGPTELSRLSSRNRLESLESPVCLEFGSQKVAQWVGFPAFQQLLGVGKLESQKKVNDFNLSSFPSFPPPKGGKKGGWKARPLSPLGPQKPWKGRGA